MNQRPSDPVLDSTKGELAEQRFRLLVESVKDYAIFMLDVEGRILTWNAGAQLLKGYRPEEAIGQPIEIFYTPEDQQRGLPRQLLGIAVAQGRVEREGWRVRKDRTRFWADVVITALRDESGATVGFTKVTRDLTERRQADEELRLSEFRLRALIDSVQDYAIFMVDASGHVQTWNAGAQRIKGYSASEILGQHISRFYVPEETGGGKAERELSQAEHTGRFEEEGWRVRKDGTRFWASVVLTAIRDPQGNLLGFAKVTRDLTDRRKAEEERLRLAQAQEAIRLRDEFLSIASHELKTPLTALQFQLHGLQKRASADEKLVGRAEKAVASVNRLTDLVDSLLDVSRMSATGLQLKLEPVVMKDLLEQVVERMAANAEATHTPLKLQPAPDGEARWDRLRIEQVLMNVIANALKYGQGSAVEVALSVERGQAALTVSDRGPGIPEGDLERIFGRFERAVSARHFGGLGLGLYVSRQIVELHGGTIQASNLSPRGACIRILLPLQPPA